MSLTKYEVRDAKTGEVLGVVEPYRIDVSPPGHRGMRITRRWWRVAGSPDRNADTRSCLAAFLGGLDRKTKMVAIDRNGVTTR